MQKIKQQIHYCLDKMLNKDLATQSPAIFTAYLELIAIIEANKLNEHELELYFSDPDVINYVKRARTFFNKWELYLEAIMHAYFVEGSLPGGVDRDYFERLRAYYIEQYRNLVMNEIRAAHIGQKTRVCHVGVGSMPLSLLMMHKYSNKCSIIGIDCEISAVTEARNCIEHKCTIEPESYDLGVIWVEHADGSDFSYSDVDVVILSSSITNKQKIVERIEQTINRDVLLIDRKISGLSHYVYQSSTFIASAGRDLSESAQFGLIETNCYSLNLTAH